MYILYFYCVLEIYIMLDHILTNSNTSAAQAKLLNQYLQQADHKPYELSLEFNIEIIEGLSNLKLIKDENVHLWLELGFKLLSIEECFQYADINNVQANGITILLKEIGQKNLDNFDQIVHVLLSKRASIQNCLVYIAFLTRYCLKSAKQTSLPRILPTFIRLSSFIIQKYLQLVNEPAKGNQDRIETDKVILKNCQSWVVGCLNKFFGQLKPVSNAQIRKLVILTITDVIGALLQIHQEEVLNKQLTGELLKNVLFGFIIKNSSIQELYSRYIPQLKDKKYNNPIQKVDIPELYQTKLLTKPINTQAYCWLIAQSIKRTPITTIVSHEYLLKLLIPAISQILPRSFSFKKQLTDLLFKIIPTHTIIQTGYQWQYPIQLLLFNLWNYDKPAYKQFSQLITYSSCHLHIQLLIILINIAHPSINQIHDYVIEQILSCNLYSSIEIFLILNRIQWKDQKIGKQMQFLDIVENLSYFGKERGELIQKWKRDGVSNEEVRSRLGKIV